MSRFMASSKTTHGTIIIIMFCSDRRGEEKREAKENNKPTSTNIFFA